VSFPQFLRELENLLFISPWPVTLMFQSDPHCPDSFFDFVAGLKSNIIANSLSKSSGKKEQYLISCFEKKISQQELTYLFPPEATVRLNCYFYRFPFSSQVN
jgi:hypothetical protein